MLTRTNSTLTNMTGDEMNRQIFMRAYDYINGWKNLFF